MAAPSVIQSGSGTSLGATTIGFSWPVATQEGSTLIAIIIRTGTADPTETPPASVWSLVSAVSGGSLSRTFIYKEENAPSRSLAQNWTWAATADGAIYGLELRSNNAATLTVDAVHHGSDTGGNPAFYLHKATRSKSSVVLFGRGNSRNTTSGGWVAGSRIPAIHGTWLGWIISRGNVAVNRVGLDVGYFLFDDYAYPHDMRDTSGGTGAGITNHNIAINLVEGTPADAPKGTSSAHVTFQRFVNTTFTAAQSKSAQLSAFTPANGDLLISSLYFFSNTSYDAFGTISLPTGWALLDENRWEHVTESFTQQFIYYKVALNEAANPTYSWSWTNSTTSELSIACYRGVDTSTIPSASRMWKHFQTPHAPRANTQGVVGTSWGTETLQRLDSHKGVVISFIRIQQPATPVFDGVTGVHTGGTAGFIATDLIWDSGEVALRSASDGGFGTYGDGQLTANAHNWHSSFWGFELGADHWAWSESTGDSWQMIG